MATGSMVPYSNPAGNNQTTPKTMTAGSTTTQAVPLSSSGSAASNP